MATTNSPKAEFATIKAVDKMAKEQIKMADDLIASYEKDIVNLKILRSLLVEVTTKAREDLTKTDEPN